MKYTYISLTITEWLGSYGARYSATLFTDDGKTRDFRTLSAEEARTLQWELLKKGATKTTHYNPLGRQIYTRNIILINFG